MKKLLGALVVLGIIAGGVYYKMQPVKEEVKEQQMSGEEYEKRIITGCRQTEKSGEGFLSCLCSSMYVLERSGRDAGIRYLNGLEERNLVKMMDVVNEASTGNDWDRFNYVTMCSMRIKQKAQLGYTTF